MMTLLIAGYQFEFLWHFVSDLDEGKAILAPESSQIYSPTSSPSILAVANELLQVLILTVMRQW
jgi:hypothetical protein